MAVALRDQTSASANATSLSLTIPSDCQTGDVAYTILMLSTGSATVTAPSGWTLLDSGDEFPLIYVYRKVLGSTDPGASETWSFNGSSEFAWASLIAFSGVDQAAPEDVSSFDFALGSNSTSIPCPSVTTSVNGDMLLIFAVSGNTVTYTGPSGWTAGPDPSPWTIGIFYEPQATAGPTGSPVITQSSSQYTGCGTIAIQPAASSGGSVTASASLTAVGSLSATGAVVHSRSAMLQALSALTAQGSVAHARSVAVAGSASVQAARAIAHSRSVALAAQATMSATGATARTRSAGLLAAGTLTAAGAITHQRSATLAATASLSATGSTAQPPVVLSATGTLTASGSVAHRRAAALGAIVTLTATGSAGTPTVPAGEIVVVLAPLSPMQICITPRAPASVVLSPLQPIQVVA